MWTRRICLLVCGSIPACVHALHPGPSNGPKHAQGRHTYTIYTANTNSWRHYNTHLSRPSSPTFYAYCANFFMTSSQALVYTRGKMFWNPRLHQVSACRNRAGRCFGIRVSVHRNRGESAADVGMSVIEESTRTMSVGSEQSTGCFWGHIMP